MKRTTTIIALLALGAMAFPTTATWKVFQATYKIKAGGNIATGTCLNCHLSKKGGKLNGYGLALKGALKAAGTKKATEAILKSVEGPYLSKINGDKVVGQD